MAQVFMALLQHLLKILLLISNRQCKSLLPSDPSLKSPPTVW